MVKLAHGVVLVCQDLGLRWLSKLVLGGKEAKMSPAGGRYCCSERFVLAVYESVSS